MPALAPVTTTTCDFQSNALMKGLALAAETSALWVLLE